MEEYLNKSKKDNLTPSEISNNLVSTFESAASDTLPKKTNFDMCSTSVQ